jgi:hypothetical protein
MLVHITEHSPPPPTAAGPLTSLISRMMATDPADRPDMATVATELHAVAADDDEATDHPTIAFASGPPTVEREVRTPAAAPVPAAAAMRLPPATPVGAGPSKDEPPEDRGRGWLLPLAAALVVLVLIAVGAMLLFGGGDDDPAATADQGTGTSARQPAGQENSDAAGSSSSAPPPESTTPTETTTAPDTTDEPSTDAAQFVTDYYALLPSDTKTAWGLLSDGMQDQVGSYGSYKGFWSTIDSVSVDSATESSGGAVTVDLTYSSDSGTESETRLITVDDTGEGLQIVGDEVV